MVYLDNAATSFPKPEEVYTAIDKCLREFCANPGRGGHRMALASARAVMEAREEISQFFNIDDPLRICFTKNATEALNIAIKSFLSAGDHVITTCMEHNSVIRPLKGLEKDKGIELTILEEDDPYGLISPEAFRKAIKENTKLIISTLSSNVNGIIMPVKEIGRIAREHNIVFLLDASQGAGTIGIDVKEMNIDLLAFPGHKGLLGPQGTGGLYVRQGLSVKTLLEGGTGSSSIKLIQPQDMPDYLESGTLNTPGIIGLGAGIRFIRRLGIDYIRSHKNNLVKNLVNGIKDIKGIKLYSSDDYENNSGIVALNIGNVNSNQVSYELDKNFDIATRGGLHCSPLAHKKLATLEQGIVRLSVGVFNTVEEIKYTINALKRISELI
ncbi:MAG TPA: aminotransferase class V-fold PLP-dependent enzyme [Clostridiaceae bacterium]|nr:aminotransferase class V-fold PLP-dependent enzyme [Clostridiaceae bacterium]